MAEKHNGAFLVIASGVALGAAALSGHLWQNASMAYALATGCATVGVLLFAIYVGLIRIIKNHLKHLCLSIVLTLREPGIGSSYTQKQAEKAQDKVKKDFERASELTSGKK